MAKRGKLLSRVPLILLIIFLSLSAVPGCDFLGKRLSDPEGVRFTEPDLEQYVLTEETPAPVMHWLYLKNNQAGVFHLFDGEDLYLLATYVGDSYQQLKIREVFINKYELVVTVQKGKSVLVPGTTDQVEAYYPDICKLPGLGFARKAGLVVVDDFSGSD